MIKQKSFKFNATLAEAFEDFCRRRVLVEKEVVAASVLHFIESDPQRREDMLIHLDEWLRARSDGPPPQA